MTWVSADYKKGPAEGATQPGEQQRPQGEAQQLNEASHTPEAQAALQGPGLEGPGQMPTSAQGPGRMATSRESATLAPLDENESMLAGPTSRPDEHVTTPANTAPRPPKSLLQSVPALLAAAKDPNAPPAVHALIALLDEQIRR